MTLVLPSSPVFPQPPDAGDVGKINLLKFPHGRSPAVLSAPVHMQENSFNLAAPHSLLAFSRGTLALVMIVAGILHFVATDAYVGIMPDYLPLHRELVYLSGILEILFGLGLLWHKTRQASGTCLIVLFIAVLPANINMAVQDIQPAGIHIPTFLLWARLPFQLVLIYWAWRVSRPAPFREETSG